MRLAWIGLLIVGFVSASPAQNVSNRDELIRAFDAVKAPGARIVLADGNYSLDKPIVLSSQQSGLTIEAIRASLRSNTFLSHPRVRGGLAGTLAA